jgi:heptaprenyl diphosphate synthase
MERKKEDVHIRKIALLVATASVLQLLESLFPHPVPGVRLGLSNMVTLIALVDIGFAAAIEVAVLRTVISSFILGSFLSPSFLLSFFGALLSTLAMGLAYKGSLKVNYVFLSLTGISVLGAVVHNITQVGLVYLLLIQQKEIFMLLPWLGISAVLMGWVNGLIVSGVCRRLANPANTEGQVKGEIPEAGIFGSGRYVGSVSPVHALTPGIKISIVILLGLLLLFMENYYFYAATFVFLAVINKLSGFSMAVLLKDLKKISIFVLSAFLFPVVLNSGGIVLWDTGVFTVTGTGLHTGVVFAIRIMLLTLSSALLMRATSPESLIAGLEKLLLPLRRFGLREERITAVIMLSWHMVPGIKKRLYDLLRYRRQSPGKFRNIISELSSTMFLIYKETEKRSV